MAAIVLKDYETACSLSENMLLAAQNGQWDALLDAWKDYHALMEQIKAKDFIPPDDIAFARKKAVLIQSILNNDEKIKTLAAARMQDLQGAAMSAGQAIKLNQAYRP